MSDPAGAPYATPADALSLDDAAVKDAGGFAYDPDPGATPTDVDPHALNYALARLREQRPSESLLSYAYGLIVCHAARSDPVEAVARIRAVIQAASDVRAERDEEWRARNATSARAEETPS